MPGHRTRVDRRLAAVLAVLALLAQLALATQPRLGATAAQDLGLSPTVICSAGRLASFDPAGPLDDGRVQHEPCSLCPAAASLAPPSRHPLVAVALPTSVAERLPPEDSAARPASSWIRPPGRASPVA